MNVNWRERIVIDPAIHHGERFPGWGGVGGWVFVWFRAWGTTGTPLHPLHPPPRGGPRGGLKIRAVSGNQKTLFPPSSPAGG